MNISILIGLVLSSVKQTEFNGSDAIIFQSNAGRTFVLYHQQDCCESVYLAETIGDLQDLVNEPILEGSEEINDASKPEEWDTTTWTFYKLRTRKGGVTLRWVGTSNGYYSEGVDFKELENGQ